MDNRNVRTINASDDMQENSQMVSESGYDNTGGTKEGDNDSRFSNIVIVGIVVWFALLMIGLGYRAGFGFQSVKGHDSANANVQEERLLDEIGVEQGY